MAEFKHDCGCITIKINGIIGFNKRCERHKNNTKSIWVASQHKDGNCVKDEGGLK